MSSVPVFSSAADAMAAVRAGLRFAAAADAAQMSVQSQAECMRDLEQADAILTGGPSLPLDIGYSLTIPAGIRNAVILRDRHCRWPGGCDQPAAACQVHHVKHKANGGNTNIKDCVLLCSFHHQVVVHRWGWTLVLNPDGTTTAWSKDKTKVLHSHEPPVRPG
jgi:hypothetical protein